MGCDVPGTAWRLMARSYLRSAEVPAIQALPGLDVEDRRSPCAACHAGGRGFESRRSRFRQPALLLRLRSVRVARLGAVCVDRVPNGQEPSSASASSSTSETPSSHGSAPVVVDDLDVASSRLAGCGAPVIRRQGVETRARPTVLRSEARGRRGLAPVRAGGAPLGRSSQ